MGLLRAALTVVVCSHVCWAEVFTSLADLEGLVHAEVELISALGRVIEAEQNKVEQLIKIRQQYQEWNAELQADREAYVHNPINAYLLVKRLSTDWQRVASLVNENVVQPLIDGLSSNESLHFPDDEDLAGAASALVRLQETYNLNTSDLARGELKGTRLKRPLTAGDCFELGRQRYLRSDFKHTAMWMWESWSMLKAETDGASVDLQEILEYLAFSTYKTGDVREGLRLTNMLLEMVPDHPRAVGNKVIYETEISKKQRRGDTGEPDLLQQNNAQEEPSSADSWHKRPEFKKYEQLCRGEITLPAPTVKRLKCFYTHNDAPFLLLQPVKTELLYDNPRLLMFHDVIYESEMQVVKDLAAPRMARATVQNSETGELETAHYRVSKAAWLKSEENHHVAQLERATARNMATGQFEAVGYRISKAAWLQDGFNPAVAQVNRRVAQLTGLDLETAEELQVSNYGIGGHYEPHYDFAREEEKNAFKSLGTGNRIATFIFYMSDVSVGGATVFTEIGATVWPRRGSAAFWYNLKRNGQGDYSTRHAACPVLIGNKWVANKWIHEQGQEFRRTCSLDPDM